MSRNEADILARPEERIPFWISATLEFRYKFPGNFIFHAHMSEFSFHAHMSEFSGLGWLGTFEVME